MIVSSDINGIGGISAKSEEGSVNVIALEDIKIHDVKKEKSGFSLSLSKDGLSF